jgi:hypothetical protein
MPVICTESSFLSLTDNGVESIKLSGFWTQCRVPKEEFSYLANTLLIPCQYLSNTLLIPCRYSTIALLLLRCYRTQIWGFGMQRCHQ